MKRCILGIACIMTAWNSSDAQQVQDSGYHWLSERLRVEIFTAIRKSDSVTGQAIDTVNFIDLYAVKFQVDKTGKAVDLLLLSKGAPDRLKTIIAAGIKTALKSSAGNRQEDSVLAGKTFILPILFDYEVYPGRKVARNLSTKSVANMTFFEEPPITRKPSAFPYTGTPVESVLLPVFYYQTPHVYPAKKKMTELYEKKQKGR